MEKDEPLSGTNICPECGFEVYFSCQCELCDYCGFDPCRCADEELERDEDEAWWLDK